VEYKETGGAVYCFSPKSHCIIYYACLIPGVIFNCLCLDVAYTYACIPTRMKFRNFISRDSAD